MKSKSLNQIYSKLIDLKWGLKKGLISARQLVRCKLKKACGSLTENKNFVFWFFSKNLELLTNI
jgi:hypothetical protein